MQEKRNCSFVTPMVLDCMSPSELVSIRCGQAVDGEAGYWQGVYGGAAYGEAVYGEAVYGEAGC